MGLIWLGCDLVTGRIIEELPDLTVDRVSARLCAYTSATASLPIPLGGHGAAPQDWESATQPGRSLLVLVMGDRPVWGGIVLDRQGGTPATVTLPTVSVEGYLDRRYVGDHVWTDADESSVIATGLAADAQDEGIGLIIDAPPTGTLRDRTYADQDDKTIYSTLRELSGVIDGPEWTVDLDWTDASQTAVAKILRVRKRIGIAAPRPNAVYSTVGDADTTYNMDEDYTAGKGANHVLATSSGEGDTRPQSAPARAADLLASGWPRWEYRFQPSSSITDVSTLDEHAQAALALMRAGTNTIAVDARATVEYPQLGVDWSIGDDITYELIGHRHPDGLTGIGRAVGWELDVASDRIKPTLLAPGEELVSG